MLLTLRPATADDLMDVGELHHRSRTAAYQGLVPDDALTAQSGAMLGRWWSERWPYERDTHLMTVAEHDDELVGFSYVGPDSDGEPGTGMLYAIHLDPDQQGRGVGRALMIDALATLHDQGFHRAALWVLTDNAHARRFYERGGWSPTATTRTDHIGPALTPQIRYTRPLP
ncbi:GNAT family N-acetyltransferase [Micromonospora zhanjiangensis]|uniref:GNAT family N-acetyltransferase n=1 Tax=Micromonospora zhanjiangensis TaxID=1522057 RepID=A0ABV8KRN4_9ACTN